MTEPVIVVNADDLGLSIGATMGIVEAHRNGVVTSASLVVTTPFFDHAVNECIRTCPDLGVGLHFSLNVGKPAAPASQVPLLLRSDGTLGADFFTTILRLQSRRSNELLSQVETELHAQIDKAEAAGVKLDHINSERHVHLIPAVFSVVARTAKARGINYIRTIHDGGFCSMNWKRLDIPIRSGGFLKYLILSAFNFKNRMRLEGLRTADRYMTLLYTGRMDLVLDRILTSPSAGVTEVGVHPGRPELNSSSEFGRSDLEIYLNSEDRRRELKACVKARQSEPSARLARFSDAFAKDGSNF